MRAATVEFDYSNMADASLEAETMSDDQTQFYGKTWIYWSQSIIFGLFTIFGLIMGPLFLTGTMERADGKPCTEAGIAITAVTLVFMLPAFVLAVFNFRIRQAPLVRICREGIEARLIGRTSIDGIPLVPAQVRLLWGFISTQIFRARLLRVLWPDLGDAQVTGLPAMRVLSIAGVFREIPDGLLIVTEPVANRVTFQQVDFKRPCKRSRMQSPSTARTNRTGVNFQAGRGHESRTVRQGRGNWHTRKRLGGSLALPESCMAIQVSALARCDHRGRAPGGGGGEQDAGPAIAC